MKLLKITLAAATVALIATPAFATNFDLQTAGSTATDGVAQFIQGGSLSGTGVFPAFVQIGGNASTTSAYNTTVNGVLDNGSSDNFNHEVTLGTIGTETYQGIQYYTFLLDINEEKNVTDKYLSVDKIQIYTSSNPNQSTTNVSTLGNLRYNLDATTDNSILLDFSLNPGSGKYDMKLLVPKSLFALDSSSSYVYLFSAFGGQGTTLVAGRNYGTSDGFEEWALNATVTQTCADFPDQPECQLADTPEPASLILLGTGLAAAAFALRRRAAKS